MIPECRIRINPWALLIVATHIEKCFSDFNPEARYPPGNGTSPLVSKNPEGRVTAPPVDQPTCLPSWSHTQFPTSKKGIQPLLIYAGCIDILIYLIFIQCVHFIQISRNCTEISSFKTFWFSIPKVLSEKAKIHVEVKAKWGSKEQLSFEFAAWKCRLIPFMITD